MTQSAQIKGNKYVNIYLFEQKRLGGYFLKSASSSPKIRLIFYQTKFPLAAITFAL